MVSRNSFSLGLMSWNPWLVWSWLLIWLNAMWNLFWSTHSEKVMGVCRGYFAMCWQFSREGACWITAYGMNTKLFTLRQFRLEYQVTIAPWCDWWVISCKINWRGQRLSPVPDCVWVAAQFFVQKHLFQSRLSWLRRGRFEFLWSGCVLFFCHVESLVVSDLILVWIGAASKTVICSPNA